MTTLMKYFPHALIGFLVTVLVILFLFAIPDNDNQDYRNWKARADTLQVENDSLKAKLAVRDGLIIQLEAATDTLEKKNEKLITTSNVLKGQVTSLKQQAAEATTLEEKVVIQTAIITKQDSIIATQDSVITTQKQEISVVKRIVMVQDSSIIDLKAMNERLSEQLKEVPKPKSDKFLGFIPMPSRTTTAIVSALATYVVIKETN
jgi:chromosome segregation ATPase